MTIYNCSHHCENRFGFILGTVCQSSFPFFVTAIWIIPTNDNTIQYIKSICDYKRWFIIRRMPIINRHTKIKKGNPKTSLLSSFRQRIIHLSWSKQGRMNGFLTFFIYSQSMSMKKEEEAKVHPHLLHSWMRLKIESESSSTQLLKKPCRSGFQWDFQTHPYI
jgi:hypothetical protein